MADSTYSIAIPISTNAKQGAADIDTLTAALKAEEKALVSTKTALARMQAGSKVDIGLATKAKEGALRIATLKKQVQQARTDGERPTKIGFIDAIEKSGGPIGGLIRNVKAAWGALAANPSAAVAMGLIGLTAASVALGGKLLGLAKDAITMGVGFADAARSSKLLNEAADIAGGSHKQLGGIIEDVRRRSDIARGTLGEMARGLRKLGFDSRQTQLVLSGMAIAESALGAGEGVKAIAEQSRAMRRFSLGARDAYGQFQSLRAIGLTKADVFAELGKASGRSIGQVQQAVNAGQISVTKGMAAIDAALQRKYGGTAKAQALSLTSQFRRMREDFEGLFEGASIEPLLAGLKSITGIFSQDTASGRAFTSVISSLMTSLGDTVAKLAPDIKEAILGLSAEAAKPGGLAATFRGWIADAKDLGATIKDVVQAIKDIGAAASAISGAIGAVKGAFTVTAGPDKLAEMNKAAGIRRQLEEQGKTAGQALTAGVAAGIDAGSDGAVMSITGLAAKLKASFSGPAGIDAHSPSKAFERRAEQIPAGVGVGVTKAAPVAVRAVVDMSTKATRGYSAPTSSGSQGGGNTYNFTATFEGMTRDDELERKVKDWLVSAIKSVADVGPAPRLV